MTLQRNVGILRMLRRQQLKQGDGMMEKQKRLKTLVLAGAITLGIGTGIILGSSALSSSAMAASNFEEVEESDNGSLAEPYDKDASRLIELEPGESYEQYIVGYDNLLECFFYNRSENNRIYRDIRSTDGTLMVWQPLTEKEALAFAPSVDMLTEQEAQSIAIQTIQERFALTDDTIEKFDITDYYYPQYRDIDINLDNDEWYYCLEIDSTVWKVDLNPENMDDFQTLGWYSVFVDATTGEVHTILTVENGKG